MALVFYVYWVPLVRLTLKSEIQVTVHVDHGPAPAGTSIRIEGSTSIYNNKELKDIDSGVVRFPWSGEVPDEIKVYVKLPNTIELLKSLKLNHGDGTLELSRSEFEPISQLPPVPVIDIPEALEPLMSLASSSEYLTPCTECVEFRFRIPEATKSSVSFRAGAARVRRTEDAMAWRWLGPDDKGLKIQWENESIARATLPSRLVVNSDFPFGAYLARATTGLPSVEAKAILLLPYSFPAVGVRYEQAAQESSGTYPLSFKSDAFAPKFAVPDSPAGDENLEPMLTIDDTPGESGFVCGRVRQKFDFEDQFLVSGCFYMVPGGGQRSLAFDLSFGNNAGDKFSVIFGKRGGRSFDVKEGMAYLDVEYAASTPRIDINGSPNYFQIVFGRAFGGDDGWVPCSVYFSTDSPPKLENHRAPVVRVNLRRALLDNDALRFRLKKWGDGKLWIQRFEVSELAQEPDGTVSSSTERVHASR